MKSKFDTTTQEYIEIIHHLQNKHKVARVKDIARTRGVTRSSVSTALNLLKKKNLIKHETYGLVELTKEGEQLGQALDKRHAVINKFFIEVLGINPKVADEDACKLEHYISTETLNGLLRFLAFIEDCPEICADWLKHFRNHKQTMKRTMERVNDVR